MFLRFRIIWGKKWSDNLEDVSLAIALCEWKPAIENFNKKQINQAIDYCKVTMVWPPSICEFIEVCENLLGIPSAEEIMQLGIRRDFSRPLVELVFNEIGSWSFSNDKEKVLLEKIKKSLNKIKTETRLKLLR